MAKKYVFTGKTKEFYKRTLKQIKRCSDSVIGGWIEKEANLSHEGDAWVSGDARVSGDAWVYGDAQVSGDVWVSGNAQVSGNARIEKNSQYITISKFVYDITITPQNAVIGRQIKTHKEWLKVTRKQAVEMGLPANKFTLFKTLLTSLFKEVQL